MLVFTKHFDATSLRYYIVFRWVKLQRGAKLSEILVVVVDDVCAADYNQYEDCFKFMKSAFPIVCIVF